ncbi:ATPase, T2SS/T4P/T4SS family [Sulfurimonas sp.]|uniref:ATPase, T2SS/T4P/T4SS family n=1 Tax=Sulfurimonas sp. TaxID=2022749 RepID=UPI002B45F8A7|nr:ATPase, T2SS/T4P/T4SS family [Sulfurimonas sp.]
MPHKSSQILKNLLSDISPILKRTDINEIILDEPGIAKLDLGNETWEYINSKVITQAFLENFPKQLATWSNQKFDEKTINLSTAIPGTYNRVNVIHKSILRSIHDCNTINIRIQKPTKFHLESFLKSEIPDSYKEAGNPTYNKNDSFEAKIKAIMDKEENVLISGGTNSGKTSLFNALIEFININYRVVTIEDSPELNIPHRNKTQLLISKSGSNISQTTYKEATDISTRIRPTVLLVGELDTNNTSTFLRLGNTGHKGMIATLHANTPVDAITALESNLGHTKNPISLKAMHNLMRSGVDHIIQMYHHQIVEIMPMKELLKENQL